MEENQKKESKMLHTLVLLVIIMLVMMILTWVIPAGEFERLVVDGREVIDPNSFRFIESSPQSVFDTLLAIPQGFMDASEIIFFVLIVGGSFTLINHTGMLESLIARLVHALDDKGEMVIPVMLFVFGVIGATIGLAEETILFIPLGIALARALGYDAIVGMSMVALGASIGFNSGFMNPFSVGVAQGIAELPVFSGIALRLVLFVVLWILTSWFLVRYARKVKKDPKNSLVADLEAEEHSESEDDAIRKLGAQDFTLRHKIILAIFILGFVVIAYGVFSLGWFISEIGVVFFVMGISSSVVAKVNINKMADLFIDGAAEMMFPALAISFARSILVVMENGLILDSIIYYLAGAVELFPPTLAAVGMYVVQIIINFMIPSGSGQAATTMPIMVPLADSVGVTRQTAVLAFQLGSGFMDAIMPMSGVLMAQLAVAKIPYDTWVKFLTRMMAIWIGTGLIFLIFAQIMGYGPF